ncbi:MAG: radical SAM protein [Pseudonocardiales bacterium]|nr:radical SAM protein [Pseudonocardiales bacterium]
MDRQEPKDGWVATRPSMIILQPTSLCNLNCAYCYLPGRKSKNEMPLPVARAIAEGINPEWMESAPLELVWHGGEPLAVGPTQFEERLKPFVALQNSGLVQHVIQTNTTLITDEWCELLLKHGVAIGVSIDGPPTLNQNRVDWQGKPAFTRIMNGIAKLIERDVDFNVIAVVDQAATDSIHQILDFFAVLRPRSIALNLEEREGVNLHDGSPSPRKARTLWRDVSSMAPSPPPRPITVASLYKLW